MLLDLLLNGALATLRMLFVEVIDQFRLGFNTTMYHPYQLWQFEIDSIWVIPFFKVIIVAISLEFLLCFGNIYRKVCACSEAIVISNKVDAGILIEHLHVILCVEEHLWNKMSVLRLQLLQFVLFALTVFLQDCLSIFKLILDLI